MTHDGMLSGLRALVTGGGSGIGAVITTCLRREGSQVLVVDADVSTAPDVVADVSSTAGVDALFDAVPQQLGKHSQEPLGAAADIACQSGPASFD